MSDEAAAGDAGDTNAQTDQTTDAAADTPAAKTFTQDQVDKIVQDRLARAKSTPPADYEDLKSKAAEFDKLQEAQKTELEKAHDRAAALERERDDARLHAQEQAVRGAIIGEASGKLADPTDAVSLIDRSAIEFNDDGSPTNIGELVGSLLEAKPHLAALGGARGTSADQGARNGGSEQVSEAALKTMSPDEIVKAQNEGRLDQLLGRS